jgi:hypothetical protein
VSRQKFVELAEEPLAIALGGTYQLIGGVASEQETTPTKPRRSQVLAIAAPVI